MHRVRQRRGPALGRPCDSFDGKVGIWRVVSERPAKNNKYVGPNAGRKKGDMIEEDCKLDGAKYVEMLTEKVFPAIRKAYKGDRGHPGRSIVNHDQLVAALRYIFPGRVVRTFPPEARTIYDQVRLWNRAAFVLADAEAEREAALRSLDHVDAARLRGVDVLQVDAEGAVGVALRGLHVRTQHGGR